jgi:hypothetical protein
MNKLFEILTLACCLVKLLVEFTMVIVAVVNQKVTTVVIIERAYHFQRKASLY